MEPTLVFSAPARGLLEGLCQGMKTPIVGSVVVKQYLTDMKLDRCERILVKIPLLTILIKIHLLTSPWPPWCVYHVMAILSDGGPALLASLIPVHSISCPIVVWPLHFPYLRTSDLNLDAFSAIEDMGCCNRPQEEPQTAYSMSFTWVSHIATSMLSWY